jgi:protocatechuate 3,4-dioxygenase beta subunit
MGMNVKRTRRQVLQSGIALAGSGLLARSGFGRASRPATCTLTAELTEGPYYVPYELVRKSITEGRPGLPLDLEIRLLDSRTCKPLPTAAVDIWHCDALGIYSGFTKDDPDKMDFGHGVVITPDNVKNAPPPPGAGDRPMPGPEGRPGPPGATGGPPMSHTTDKETFLRGIQVTDVNGVASFQTIYPGWYVSRDVHIHLKVHLGGHMESGMDFGRHPLPKYTAGHVSHTGQIAFSDELTDEVAKIAPYNTHKARRTRLSEDSVFRTEQSISESMLKITRLDAKRLSVGLRGTITFAVDPDSTPANA